jgi:signal transduction histidine kinase
VGSWVNNSVTGICDANGHPQGILAVSIDITERKNSEETQRLLVNGLNHRVKNALAVVRALVTRRSDVVRLRP